MKTKKIEINGRTIEIKEISYLEFLGIASLKDNAKEFTKKLWELSGVPIEFVESIGFSDGEILTKEINELNGFGNFTQTQP